MSQLDVLAFGAHPDDVEITMGGTILRMKSQGYSVGVVDMTRGEKGTRGTGETRKAEADAATKMLGIDFRVNLNLGDQHVQDTQDRRRAVVEVIRKHKPKIVFTHWTHDRHPDHEGTSELVKHAMFLSGAGKFEADGELHVPKTLLYYPSTWMIDPNVFVDITPFYEKKIEAVKCYATQFHNPESNEPRTRLSRPDFFDDIAVRFRNWGIQAGVKYAEAFFTRDKFLIDDPIAFFAKKGDSKWVS